jgi:ribulose-bisphosphate carboxylase small chain
VSTEIDRDPPRFGGPARWHLETFSFLGDMDAAQVRRQIQFMLDRGWTCAIEHVEPERAIDTYWYMWKLPLFGERSADIVLGELMACRNAHPRHHVRAIGYDNRRQTQGLNMVVFRGA